MSKRRDQRTRLHASRAPSRSDWIVDRLIDLVAREEMQRSDSAFYVDAHFIASMAADFRAHADMAGDEDDPELDAIAWHIYERVLELRLPNRVAGAWPSERAAEVASPPSLAIAEARRARCAPRYDLSIAAGTGRELWNEPCTSWIQLPDGVATGDHVALTVRGDSMEPLIHSHDVVLVRLGHDFAADDLIVARSMDDGYVIKRVGRLSGSAIELTSLNPEFEPLLIPNDPSRVLGTVILRWCSHDRGEKRALIHT